MAVNPTSLLSVLMKPNTMGDGQTLIDAMLAIQTQLSEIQENQRKIMKALRDLRIEERSRLSDLKKSTQVLLKASHSALSDQLNELQDSVDDQLGEDIVVGDDFDLENIFKK
ncbi:MAG: hypothetical protein J6S69_06900 [Proteobacteria bacterium]|jgi:hypothetical protein|nr:hypothetical protein [Pseudomonadota bacterium]